MFVSSQFEVRGTSQSHCSLNPPNLIKIIKNVSGEIIHNSILSIKSTNRFYFFKELSAKTSTSDSNKNFFSFVNRPLMVKDI